MELQFSINLQIDETFDLFCTALNFFSVRDKFQKYIYKIRFS